MNPKQEPINPKTEAYRQCVGLFLEAYEQATGLLYAFSGKDGKALKDILAKIDAIRNPDANEVMIFSIIINRLPQWVRDNYFSLPNINKNFNQIVKQIKDESNSKKRSVSGDYIQRQLDILQS